MIFLKSCSYQSTILQLSILFKRIAALYIRNRLVFVSNLSSLTGSESQGQEAAAYTHPAKATTGVLFTATNTMKLPSTVTWSSWELPLSYYRVSTFLPCRISKPKMNELSATIVRNQQFQLLWHPFPYLRLKLDHLNSNSIVTRELIALFYVESANQNSLQSIQPPL